MSKDSEMKTEEGEKKEEDAEKKEVEKDVLEMLIECAALVEKSVASKGEPRFIAKVLRQSMGTIRRKVTAEKLADFLKTVLPAESAMLSPLMKYLGSGGSGAELSPQPSALQEMEAYACLMVLIFMIDQKDARCKECATMAVKHLGQYNRRTLDILAARIYFYYSLAYELFGELVEVRSTLLALHRTAALRLDEIGQETVLNLLLRNYLHYNLYDQAERLRAKAQLPTSRSNQQQCRYLYYLGRIRAIQLDYSEAKECLTQAHRKSPKVAKGFQLELVKWIAIVRLLLGEIPERKMLCQPGLKAALLPYFELTQAVRMGDLNAFKAVTEQHGAAFAKDKTSNLITRLRRNVIRTGLVRIATAYSRISLKDVAAKLGLSVGEDVECIVAKAIRDGGIEAVLDHEAALMYSKEATDLYSTQEPQAAFHARIAFCLDTHNEAVRAMRYPPNAHKKIKEDALSRKDRAAAEAEIAQAMMDDEDDF